MRFTALNISEGDSFLLQTEGRIIVVDTGNNKSECRDQLIIEGVNVINELIITHYDRDHVGGLIELIKSSIQLDEIWLPDNFGRISKTLDEKTSEILNKIKDIELNSNDNVKSERDGIETSLIESYTLTSNEVYRSLVIYKSILMKKHIELIQEIIHECAKKKIRVRWLKYTGCYNEIHIKNDLVGINCIENKNITSYVDDLEVLYFLTRINQECIVIKYSNKNMPNVLFTSDSGFEFIATKDKIKLKDNSIATAPHHGSNNIENEKGYQIVQGEGIIYVRSESFRVTVSQKFRGLTEKYCVKCDTMKSEKVTLEYGNAWVANKNECNCS